MPGGLICLVYSDFLLSMGLFSFGLSNELDLNSMDGYFLVIFSFGPYFDGLIFIRLEQRAGS